VAFLFLDELGVEPLAYVGLDPDIALVIPDVIHRLYSTAKFNAVTKYSCGRYLHTLEKNRIIDTPAESRFIDTIKGNCK